MHAHQASAQSPLSKGMTPPITQGEDVTKYRADMKTPNAQYNLAEPDSLAMRATAHMRKKMFDRFVADLQPAPDDTILDIGATSDQSYASSNYLEAWYPNRAKITATGIDDASHLETIYPGVKFVPGNGRALPFGDATFDLVHSSAVIEHVGSRDDQLRFVAEAWRVARRGIFLTTPNRWFPIEVHTSIPLLHWLPAANYRKLLRKLGLSFFADEKNLNLLSCGDLSSLSGKANLQKVRVGSVSLLGWPSNLILVAFKQGASAPQSASRPMTAKDQR